MAKGDDVVKAETIEELEWRIEEDEGLWHTPGGLDCMVIDGAGNEVGAFVDAAKAQLACEMRNALPELLRERQTQHDKLLAIASIINAHFHGDDGELTPGQSAKIALDAIRETLEDR
jgi:hypothetical protein